MQRPSDAAAASVPPDEFGISLLPDHGPIAAEERAEVRFAIDRSATPLPAGAPPEPRLSGPVTVEFGEPERLDPERASAEPQTAEAAARRQSLRLGLAGSIGVHLLPLLLLATWHPTPAEIAAPIPVQLVELKEKLPPPPPPPKFEAPKPPPSGRLASAEIGDPTAKPDKPGEASEPAAAPVKQTNLASPAPKPQPRPEPEPPPELVSMLPKPAPAPEPDLTPAEPQATPPLNPPVKEAVAERLLPKPRPAPHRGEVLGPAATRDEYLAYCMTLVRQHYGLLPATFLAGRRGVTVLKILVLGDGTIARITIAANSGYSDIDTRVEQMIAAVHRFPPLPQWIQRDSITMTYELAFPEGLRER